MVEFNPYSYEFHADPYPIYQRLRDEAPAYWNETLGFWALSRHADVLAGFKDAALLSNVQGVSLERSSGGEAAALASFLAMDPPRHDQMRGLVARGFTPRRVAELEPRVRELADQHIDRFIDRGTCDFIQEFAGKLPMDVVSELLGVPSSDRDTLRHWADAVLHREEGNPAIPPAAMEATGNLLVYYAQLLGERKQRPGGDLISALLDT